jgi:uncharacterized protein YegL
MVGEALSKMEDGLQSIMRTLRTDPHALETVHVSVIAFAGIAKKIAPLIEVASFYPPKLPLGSGTSLGAALETLMAEIDTSVIKTTPDLKGDWRPIVYLFTDGRPTDNPIPAIERWKARYASQATLIAVGLGKDADFTTLKKLTDHTIVFEDTKEGNFKKFVAWVTASLLVQSKSTGERQQHAQLPVFDEQVMRIVKEPQPVADEACVTLVGRCQKTRRPYIIRYGRRLRSVGTRDFSVDVASYHLDGCHPLDEDYFAWSDQRAADLKVNTSSLVGSPGCPHCGNFTAFAVCGCGKLLCVNGPGKVVCPWCEESVSFGPAPEEAGGFDVGRGRG